jgi:hypothetical protein
LKIIIALLALLLLCSTTALADFSIRVGGLYGFYILSDYPLGKNTYGNGGYVSVKSLPESLPWGFSGSYSVSTADKYKAKGFFGYSHPTEAVFEDRNNVSLIKAFIGYRFPETRIALGGGWISLTHLIEGSEGGSAFTTDCYAIAVFTSAKVSSWLEFNSEFFYAPMVDFLDADATGRGFELSGTLYPLPPVGIEGVLA